MSDDYSRVLNLVGLTLGLLGVLILFRWGMPPFRVPSEGGTVMTLVTVLPQNAARDHIYTMCVGLGLPS
jgi:hypothetical protein